MRALARDQSSCSRGFCSAGMAACRRGNSGSGRCSKLQCAAHGASTGGSLQHRSGGSSHCTPLAPFIALSRLLLAALLAILLTVHPSAAQQLRTPARLPAAAADAAASAAAAAEQATAPVSALLPGADAPVSRLPAAGGGVIDSKPVTPQIEIVNSVVQLQQAVAAGVEHIVVRKNLEDTEALEAGPILGDVSRTKVIRVQIPCFVFLIPNSGCKFLHHVLTPSWAL